MSAMIYRRLLAPIFLSACLFWLAPAAAVDFVGGNLGSIPDDDPAGRDVTFAVGGISSGLADVRVSMTLAHTYVGDLDVELIAPSGAARRVVFSRTGAGAMGAGSDLGGTYAFNDRAPLDWWQAAAAGGTIAPGSYRASTAGFFNGLNAGGCATLLTFAFDHLAPAQINGTWTLHVADLEGADTGAISAAKLTLIPTDDAVFGDGFDAPLRGSCTRAQFDYTGSNRSSYVVVRNTGGGANGAITWFVRDNDGTATGAERSFALGNAGDFFIGGDFDGDGIWDPAVWTAGNPGHFKAILSSRPNGPLLEFDFGQSGDDPSQSGDYDGDGKTDLALYRSGAAAGDPSFTVIRLSSTNTDRILATGEYGNFAAGGSDLDGDGHADVAIQSNAGGGSAMFDLYSGVDGSVLDSFLFGTPTDIIVSGNHSGNAQADVTVVHGSGGKLLWNTRDSGTGTAQPEVAFGLSATDFVLSGDFDGDGRDDYSVWRPSATPGQSAFFVLPSSDPNTSFTVNFGQNGDYPVGNTRRH